MAPKNPGQPRRRRGKYWLDGRDKRLNPWLYMERLAQSSPFRRFFVAFANYSNTGYIHTAAGLHNLCREQGIRVSLGTIYNYLRKLDRVGMIKQEFNGRTSYFDLDKDEDNYWDMVNIVNGYSE